MRKRKKKRYLAILAAVLVAATAGLYFSVPRSPSRWMVEGIACTDDLNLNGFSLDRAVLARGPADLAGVAVVVDHDSARVAGCIERAWLVRDELHIRVEVSKTAPEVWEQVKDGSLARFSINVRALRTYPGMDEVMGSVVRVKAGIFMGVSFVTRPADLRAVVTRWYEGD